MDRPCPPAPRRGPRPTPSGTGHDDCAGSPTIVHDAVRPRRPTIRHCIGVRSWASSMSTCANGSSSIRCVGGAQARPVGAYSRSAAVISSCMSTPPSATESVSSRSRSSSVLRRHVAERVAQLVEQRHVLHRQRRARRPTTSRAAAAPRRRARRRPTRARNSGSRSQPSTVGASSGGHHATAKSRNRACREHLLVERLAAPLAATLAAHLAPHGVEQRVRHPRQLPVAPALRHQLAPQPAQHAPVEHDRVVAPEDPELAPGCPAPAGAPYDASARPSGRSP